MRVLFRRVQDVLLLAALASAFLVAFGASSSTAAPALGQYIVVLEPWADRAAAVVAARSLGGDVFMEYSHALNGFAARLSVSATTVIQSRPEILFVAPDRDFEAVATSAACSDFAVCQRTPSGIDRVDADLSSARSGDGRDTVNVNVAVIDSGIDLAHPDLNVVGGTDCTSGKGFDDLGGHGTHVAGIVGASDNAFGVVGVAPGARLWAVRVLDKFGRGKASTLACGIDWVTSTRRDGNPANDIAVANMSITGSGSDDANCGQTNEDPVHVAICSSVGAGVAYVVAAGNSGVDFQSRSPAAYDEVLTATAIADFDGRAGGLASSAGSCVPPEAQPNVGDDEAVFFSNFATLAADQAHTIAAPGVCILSTAAPNSTLFPGNTLYAEESGTSMAAPHVAGTVALCLASGGCRGLTPAQIVVKIVGDAAAYNTARKNSGYGFQGDPLRPVSGRYYGYLARAAPY